MNVSFMLTALLCTLIGGSGYYMFGSAARDIVTFNLPSVRVYPASVPPSFANSNLCVGPMSIVNLC